MTTKKWRDYAYWLTYDGRMTSPLAWITPISSGVLLKIQVQPNASRTEIVGPFGETPAEQRLKIRIAAPPVDSAANEELLAFLKKKLKVKNSDLTLVRGQTSKKKDVACSGINEAQAVQALQPGAH